MLIDITGYVTELHGENGFEIKVTSDTVHSREFTNLQVSKEVRIWINAYRYPSDDGGEFKLTTVEDKDYRKKINKCRSLSKALELGDQVTCAVFVVERETRNEVETYAINKRPKDIKTYAEFDLWLCPYDDCFQRLEVDSRESLKFRRQWFYTCVNGEKYKKITGYSCGNHWWINKNPKIIFPILWLIRVKTTISNLWEKFTGQEKNKSTTINTIVTIIAIVVGIIGIVITIWLNNRNPSP